ncbi:MAG: CHAD domain-containing protein [Dehalococcoidia bacterium]
MTADQMEIEWQYAALDTRPVVRWLQGTMPAGYTVERVGLKELDDTYFDTEEWHLNRAGYTCRIRRKGDSAELTLKSRAEPTGAMRTRRELNEFLDPDVLTPAAAPGSCGAIVRAVAGRFPLQEQFRLETQREVFNLSDSEGVIAEVAVDETSIPVGEDRPVRLSRVEVEVDPSAVERTRRFVEVLVAENRLTEAGTSKFESALIATGKTVPAAPEPLGPTTPSPEMTAGEVAYAVLRKQYAAMRANEPGTRLGEDIEALHDMRVATRRLRAAMAAFRPVLTPRMQRFRDQLGWLASALGEVRDLDVQLERMHEWRANFPPERAAALESVEGLLNARRRAARKRMLTVLDSRRYERLCGSFASALKAGPPKSFAPGRAPILAIAPDMVEKRYKRVRKQGDSITKDSPPEAYHLLRIDAKKLRYALEFVGTGIYGKPAVEFSARVTAMQDVLGLHQDAYVAMDLLQEIADSSGRRLGPSTLMAMGSIAERYRLDAIELRSKFPAVYKPLAGDEWRKLQRLMESRRPAVPKAVQASAPSRKRPLTQRVNQPQRRTP